jgi:hypothetical protein
MAAAYLAAERGRRDLLSALVEDLGDRDESVRFVAAIALRRLTGQDLGYRSYAPPAAREEAIVRWRRWLGEGAGPAGEEPADAAPLSARPVLQSAGTGEEP